MSEAIFFSFPGNEILTDRLVELLNTSRGRAEFRRFPDGESYVRILSGVRNKQVFLVCSLQQPDDKFLSVYFFCKIAKSLGAKKICLVVPYLAYMRQDKVFKTGEGITAAYFGELISKMAEALVTIDPHLHRIGSLTSIYSIPVQVVHAAKAISTWIKEKVQAPFLIGPDQESKNWVAMVAAHIGCPYVILHKTRLGDKKVSIQLPDLGSYKDQTPVLVDDIISTARTMIAVMAQLKSLELKPAVAIGIHAVFTGNAYQELLQAGVGKVVTCNTIVHPSNQIDLSSELATKLVQLAGEQGM